MTNLSLEALAIIAKVEKLLALAGNNDNENQASAATAKAMELLAAYNLDMAVIGKSGKGAQRNDTRLKGGLYQWQRDLWLAVAKLNFCLYRSIRGLSKGSVYEHRVIGSHVNVVSTKAMADYVQQTIERLAQEWANDEGYSSVFVKEAVAYREGMAERIVERLDTIRRDRLAADEAKKQQEATRSRHPASAPGTSLVLADVLQSESDLNQDHIHGLEPGTTAANRAMWAARQAAAQAKADEALAARIAAEIADPSLKAAREAREADDKARADKEYADWCKKFERNQKRRTGSSRDRAESPREQRRNSRAFGDGYSKGGDVGLDQQISRDSRRTIG